MNDNEGYFCYKIPSLTKTHNNTLLATAEARIGSCSDYTTTVLVLKKSYDGGKTWSRLQTLYKEDGNVIGQAVPVQLKNGRILLPFNRGNVDCLIMNSDDFGETWSQPKPIENCTHSNWSWIGFGPPASIQLESGRVLIPSYHQTILGQKLNGLISSGHMLISDDNGETWRINQDHEIRNNFPLFSKGGWKTFPPAI